MKHGIRFIFTVLGIALFAGTALAARNDVSAQLSAKQSSLSARDDVVLSLSITNLGNQPVRMLKWYLPSDEPEERAFAVSRDGVPVAYNGPHYKRTAPGKDDYQKVMPGQAMHYTVELSALYDFSGTGLYTIQYDVASLNLLGHDKKHVDSVQSNEVTVWVQGDASKLAVMTNSSPIQAAASLSYSRCSNTQQSTLVSAVGAASTMANGATSYLGGSPSATPRYTTWFGTYSASGWNTAKNHFIAIKDVYDTKAITFDCGCKKKNVYAYVYPNQPYKIYLCGVFWTAPLTGTDSKGGTLIHETSHFDNVAGTDDWAYGQTNAKALAISDPTKALDNADSHEYFAENTPANP